MTVHTGGSAGLRTIGLPSAESGDVFEHWNFCQLTPHTAIFAGVSGLTFRGCNLMNCAVPVDATVEDCLVCQGSFCSHVHPDYVALGLAECVENCQHVVSAEEVIIDGQSLGVSYTYADTSV